MKKNRPLALLLAALTSLTLLLLGTEAAPVRFERPSAGGPALSHPVTGSAQDQSKVSLFPLGGVQVGPVGPARPDPATPSHLSQAYGKLPLAFEPNHGQTDSQVKFLSRGGGYTLFLTSTEAVFVFTKFEARPKTAKFRLPRPGLAEPPNPTQTVVRMQLVGANPEPRGAGLEELPGKVNYFIGNDPKKWRTNVPTYARVEYKDVYPGVNLVYYGNQRQLEYDFVVAPSADPKAIRLAFHGVDKLALDARGNLILHTAVGEIRQQSPNVYQTINGKRRDVAGRYVLRGKDRVGFHVAAYDRTKPLVIDPVLVYSTYLGGSSRDDAFGIAVDTSGNAYLAGFTASVDFPTASALQASNSGGFDAFVAKVNASGSGLVYSTYLGGSGGDFGGFIAVDAFGNAYVTGSTTSANFPTVNPIQPTFGGVGTFGNGDAFLAKLDATGSALVYSTYLGGSRDESGNDIAVDSSGNAYVMGNTESPNFPTANALQPVFGGGLFDAFVAKVNPTGSALVYSTYLGGSGDDFGFGIAADAGGNAYVTGETMSLNFPTANALQPLFGGGAIFGDAFVAKLNSTGSALVYSTYLGGSGDDFGGDIAVDGSGNAYVVGATNSSDFPTVNPFQSTLAGSFDAFVAKLNPAGSALVYSTYLGGSGDDFAFGIKVDSTESAYVTGNTPSPNFPTANPIQAVFGGGSTFFGDAFVTKVNPTGSVLTFSTYLGGSGDDEGVNIAVDVAGSAYVAGATDSPNFPTVNPLQPAFAGGGFDAFVAKLLAFNTLPGSNVSVSAGSGTTVTFTAVSSPGDTTATTSSTGPTPPVGFSLGTPPTYYDIKTTASFTAPITVCITYDPAQFGDPTSLHLLHFESNVWVDVTTSNDTTNHVICAQVSTLSPFVITQSAVVPVTIDIKPGTFPNAINLGSGGTVPVAIFSTATFDARTVDPTSVTLASAPVGLTGKGTPMASFQDVNGDGRLDLVVHVETKALQLSETDTIAVLAGNTFDGKAIRGTDLVRVVP